jgi:hypothetical protein
MVTVKGVLLNHLEYTFEKEAWQPPLLRAIEGLTAAHAAWKPSPARHSIWQIVRHVLRRKRATLEAWDGSKPLYRSGINGSPTPHAMDLESSDWQDVAGDQEAWQADVAALRDVSEKMKARVHTADEASLQQPFPGEEMPAVLRLVRMATHDVYHSGQIRYLRALGGL